jgi:hypothetical protein
MSRGRALPGQGAAPRGAGGTRTWGPGAAPRGRAWSRAAEGQGHVARGLGVAPPRAKAAQGRVGKEKGEGDREREREERGANLGIQKSVITVTGSPRAKRWEREVEERERQLLRGKIK